MVETVSRDYLPYLRAGRIILETLLFKAIKTSDDHLGPITYYRTHGLQRVGGASLSSLSLDTGLFGRCI